MTRLLDKGTPGRRKLHAHDAVADQARELCLSCYEVLMSESDVVWRAWQAQHPGLSRRGLENAFVKTFLFRFVPAARAMMAARLQAPIDDGTKAAIYDALVLDATLVRGRGRPLGG